MIIETVYVELLDEGTTVWRPAPALRLAEGLYCLLSSPKYDPEDEKWAFVPGTIVRCETRSLLGIGNEPSDYEVAISAVPLAELIAAPRAQ